MNYKRNIYWLNTLKYCGGVAVDQNGLVYKWDTAPCYQWMHGKRFSEMLTYFKKKRWLINCKKINVDVDPF